MAQLTKSVSWAIWCFRGLFVIVAYYLSEITSQTLAVSHSDMPVHKHIWQAFVLTERIEIIGGSMNIPVIQDANIRCVPLFDQNIKHWQNSLNDVMKRCGENLALWARNQYKSILAEKFLRHNSQSAIKMLSTKRKTRCAATGFWFLVLFPLVAAICDSNEFV